MRIIKPVKYKFQGKLLKGLLEMSASCRWMKKSEMRAYICKCLNISRPRLSLYEKEKVMPNINHILWFMNFFKVSDIKSFVKVK